MSFENYPNVSTALVAKVQASLKPRHNFVRVIMTGCSRQLRESVEAALDRAAFPKTQEAMQEYFFEGGLIAQQRGGPVRWVRDSDTTRIPFHLVVGKKRANVIHAIPSISIILSRRVLLAPAEIDKLRTMPYSDMRFKVTRTWRHPKDGWAYSTVLGTPLGESRDMERALEHDERQLCSVAVSAHLRDVQDSMEFACVNVLNLVQGLYNKELSVRLEP